MSPASEPRGAGGARKRRDEMIRYQDRQEAAAVFAGERPEACDDDHLTFLDELRESAVTNMFGARPYLMEEFPALTAGQAGAILGYWMKTFGAASR
jgi:hypothetical protein